MRRFINSMVGRVLVHAAVVAWVAPSLLFGLSSKAEAQVQAGPSWAVVDFVCAKNPEVGIAASEAVQSALGKLPLIDLIPRDTVNRTTDSLGLARPVSDLVSLMRLGDELRAMSIVTGEVKDFRVSSVGGGKKADVALRVKVIDVASGLGVNGAALVASSSVRTGDVDDMTVVNEALAAAAAQVVTEIRSKTLPAATVLNTGADNRTALINQGSRAGFDKGQELIVHRGREQVATARVTEVNPDSSVARVEKSIKGIQPGDKVRVIFDVPDISPIRADGTASIRKPSIGRPRSDFGTLVVILGIVGLLLSQGRSSGFSPADQVNAEAAMFPNFSGSPAVRVSWRRDTFARGNSQVVQWQVYRNDVIGSPVLVVPGVLSEGFDDNVATRDVTFGDFGGVIGGNFCQFPDEVPEETATVAGITPGRSYTYEVALVYKLLAIDLPDGGGETDATECFFISRRVPAKGLATPVNRPGLVSPGPNAVISTDMPFTFNSVANPAFPGIYEYALQISSDPSFPANKTKVYATVRRGDLGTLSTGTVDLFDSQNRFIPGLDFKLPTLQEWYWRIGARNTADRPGPVKDPSGARYVFGEPRRFTIPAPPPPPPAANEDN